MRLLHPQEIEVFYLIPAIRREFAILLKEKGMGQNEISKLLGITEAAVSQYLNNKRASEIKFNGEIKDAIKDSVENIKGTIDSVSETQKILLLARKNKFICQIHHKLSGEIEEDCNICFSEK